MNIAALKELALNILFPKRCKYCGDIIVPEASVCDKCRDNLPKICSPICHLCGHSNEDCKCKKHKNEYSAVVSPFYYEGGVRKAIHRLKFSGLRYVSETLAYDMAETVIREYGGIEFDLITFVPFSKEQRKNREYNQSELLANGLSKLLNVPSGDLLVKPYDTKPQHSLNKKERKGNVFGVFDVKEKTTLDGKVILLVDDIKTTGSTLGECAKMLRLSGADKVYCVCAAVTKTDK